MFALVAVLLANADGRSGIALSRLLSVRADRRQTRVCITTKGTHLIASLCEQALQHQKAVLAPFGEERAALLIEMLGVLMTEHVPLELPIDADE